jgi:hypothetical protein
VVPHESLFKNSFMLIGLTSLGPNETTHAIKTIANFAHDGNVGVHSLSPFLQVQTSVTKSFL